MNKEECAAEDLAPFFIEFLNWMTSYIYLSWIQKDLPMCPDIYSSLDVNYLARKVSEELAAVHGSL